MCRRKSTRLLHRVLRLADAAQRPKGDVEQVAVVLTPDAPQSSVELELELAGIAHAVPRSSGCAAPTTRPVGSRNRKRRTTEPECDAAPVEPGPNRPIWSRAEAALMLSVRRVVPVVDGAKGTPRLLVEGLNDVPSGVLHLP